jgi:hypothetical protein
VKAHGKGQGISINGSGGTSHINDWKMKLQAMTERVPVPEFRPLQVKTHPRAAEMQAYAAIQSRKP